jgi:hypothetical protein
MGAPTNALGGIVPLRLVLAQSDDAVVIVRDLVAYRSGLSLTLEARLERNRDRDSHVFFHRMLHPEGPELRPEFLRFGVELADGTKATNTADRRSIWRTLHEHGKPPTGPLLTQGSGRGGGSSYELEYWLWPLPPAGRLTFVCEWPAFAIPLTRTDVDAQLIRDAAERTRLLWGDTEERIDPFQGGSGSIQMFVQRKDEETSE